MKTEEVGAALLETWSVDEVADAFDRNEIVLIDVRTPQEYMFEHVVGSLLMPMSFFAPRYLPSQGTKRIVLHCGSGVRSEKMARAAIAAGIDKIAHMGGGFGAWKEAKLPYMGTDMGTGAPSMVNPD